MYVTYAPEDGDRREWVFDPKKVRASKAEMIEKRYNGDWDSWLGAIQTGNMRARRVLLWHLLTQEHPTLRWEDVPDFYAGELTVEYSVAELLEIKARGEKAGLKGEEREQFLAVLDAQMAEAVAREERLKTKDQAEGKARSKRSGSNTPSP